LLREPLDYLALTLWTLPDATSSRPVEVAYAAGLILIGLAVCALSARAGR
jgi:hypothetical protein